MQGYKRQRQCILRTSEYLVKYIEMDGLNTAYFTYSGLVSNFSLLLSSIVLWALSSSWYPALDGVSIYEMRSIFPNRAHFKNIPTKSNQYEAFAAESLMLDYCVFPKVYNALITKNPGVKGEISSYLKTRGLTDSEADRVENIWKGISSDFSAMGKTNTEYGLPYDGLIVPAGKTELSSQYFSPSCRCINKVLNLFESKPNTDEEFNKAVTLIDNCLATQHSIKRQTLLGNNDNKNSDIKSRKYLSRYALLFQLCLSFLIGFFYNMINFTQPLGCEVICSKNGMCYGGLFIVFLLLWLGHMFSAVNSLHTENSIAFSSLLALPALGLGLLVEYMWSIVAKTADIARQTYMHPLCFFFTVSALYMIALIENGVFTVSVIITQILQCNAMSIAYAGALFVSHGNLWWNNSSSRTGFILLLSLTAVMHLFFLVPVFPINCEVNILWHMPAVFAVLCYAKILLIDQFMNNEPNIDDHGKFKITHSDYFLIRGQVLVIAIVVFYYIIQLANLGLAKSGAAMMGMSGGRLTNRLNFAFGEINVISRDDTPLYNALKQNASDIFYINP